ncbi:hypothetical protein M427DRAFT_61867 [Gonapodya prolifera JEL478]|uniref:LITAF domain-containing protein n=1 Tax=Gonapodya prolifera (strain JEL478) TaxID=1344416 RepID=A0A139A1M7_GONPJ|nr:hypothetical protein M427DRAFT_61867 [Gonapodya prolifera JEL478]|eukprot:KXS10662.1 hypothetical protein M427DRAFT_61867 [Gonapodya prolifera JEL478]
MGHPSRTEPDVSPPPYSVVSKTAPESSPAPPAYQSGPTTIPTTRVYRATVSTQPVEGYGYAIVGETPIASHPQPFGASRCDRRATLHEWKAERRAWKAQCRAEKRAACAERKAWKREYKEAMHARKYGSAPAPVTGPVVANVAPPRAPLSSDPRNVEYVVTRSGHHVQTSIVVCCPRCNEQVVTVVKRKPSGMAWGAAALLLVVGAWPVAWVPLVVGPLKNKVHVCPRCRAKIAIQKFNA